MKRVKEDELLIFFALAIVSGAIVVMSDSGSITAAVISDVEQGSYLPEINLGTQRTEPETPAKLIVAEKSISKKSLYADSLLALVLLTLILNLVWINKYPNDVTLKLQKESDYKSEKYIKLAEPEWEMQIDEPPIIAKIKELIKLREIGNTEIKVGKRELKR